MFVWRLVKIIDYLLKLSGGECIGTASSTQPNTKNDF